VLVVRNDAQPQPQAVVVAAEALLQERVPPEGIPLPYPALHGALRDFLLDFAERHAAALRALEFTAACSSCTATVSLGELLATGLLAAEERPARKSLLRVSEQCAALPPAAGGCACTISRGGSSAALLRMQRG
jgi:hypothetical protein